MTQVRADIKRMETNNKIDFNEFCCTCTECGKKKCVAVTIDGEQYIHLHETELTLAVIGWHRVDHETVRCYSCHKHWSEQQDRERKKDEAN